jgi:hypothetical protein
MKHLHGVENFVVRRAPDPDGACGARADVCCAEIVLKLVEMGAVPSGVVRASLLLAPISRIYSAAEVALIKMGQSASASAHSTPPPSPAPVPSTLASPRTPLLLTDDGRLGRGALPLFQPLPDNICEEYVVVSMVQIAMESNGTKTFFTVADVVKRVIENYYVHSAFQNLAHQSKSCVRQRVASVLKRLVEFTNETIGAVHALYLVYGTMPVWTRADGKGVCGDNVSYEALRRCVKQCLDSMRSDSSRGPFLWQKSRQSRMRARRRAELARG